jgi:N-acetylneuraminic acid mutarotase
VYTVACRGSSLPNPTPVAYAAWTWVGGSNVGNQSGVYGTLGTAASSNIPGARSDAATWVDASGNLWLFGGQGFDSNGALADFNDLWKYSGGQWTWMGGSSVNNKSGIYGTEGTASSSNMPGARISPATWTDASGNLWLFGGNGYGSTAGEGDLNDLWEYSAGKWTWVGGFRGRRCVGLRADAPRVSDR